MTKGNKFELSADVVGDTEIEKYETTGLIKAVTYQEMEIKKEKGNWMVQAGWL